MKQGYPLLNLKKLATQYSGMGEINFFTRVVPYFILLAGIAGIVLILIYFAGDHDTWNIFNLNMFIPVVASGVGLFIIRHHQTIRAIREILNDHYREYARKRLYRICRIRSRILSIGSGRYDQSGECGMLLCT